MVSNGEGIITGDISEEYNSGTAIGLIGIVLAIFALFPTWYYVQAEVSAGEYATDGYVDIVVIDGWRGVQVYDIKSGGGTVSLASWCIPIGVFALIGFLWSAVSILRSKRSSTRSSMFFRGSIITILPLIAIIGIVVLLPHLLPENASDAVVGILEKMASSPLGGEASETYGDYLDVKMRWGLGYGSIMLIASSAIQFLGGILERRVE